MSRSYAPADLHREAASPLDLAAHGVFWTGVERVQTAAGTLARGQACVEFFVPRALDKPVPIVLVHGGGQGTDFLATASGGPGWAHHFVRQGYATYVVDLPGHGRSPAHIDQVGAVAPPGSYEFAAGMFTAPERNPQAWPQAALHTQWPADEEALDAFVASGGPMRIDLAVAQADGQHAIAALLDEIGRAILLTHSGGAPVGWLAADARPDLVVAIVAVEPFGPPVTGMGPMSLPWGITAAPIGYDPPVGDVAELRFEQRAPARAGNVPCMVQAEPARRLPGLSAMPISVVTAEASWMTMDNHGIVDFLLQAGAQVDHLRLEEAGVRGNGHLPMLEKNSADVAEVIMRWLRGHAL